MPGEDGLSHPRSERHGANVASSDFGPCSMSSMKILAPNLESFFAKFTIKLSNGSSRHFIPIYKAYNKLHASARSDPLIVKISGRRSYGWLLSNSPIPSLSLSHRGPTSCSRYSSTSHASAYT